MKDHGPKNPLPRCNLGALFPSPSGHFFKKNQLSVLSIYIVVLGLTNKVLRMASKKPSFYTLDAQTDISVTIVLSASYASSSFSKFLFKSVSRARPGHARICVFFLSSLFKLCQTMLQKQKKPSILFL